MEDCSTNITGATPEQIAAFKEVIDRFELTNDKISLATREFTDALNNGLKGEKDSLPMFPSLITGRPTGEEKGTYLGLTIDTGGLELHVSLVTLLGNRKLQRNVQKFTVAAPGQSNLMDFAADCVQQFVSTHDVRPDETLLSGGYIPLGFTFAFPMKHTSKVEGILMGWNKDFYAPGLVGRSVSRLLADAITRRNLKVKVVGVANNVVAELLAASYISPNTHIAAIFGTGTNAAYYESTKRLASRLPNNNDSPSSTTPATTATDDVMAINTEWGNFDPQGVILPVSLHDNKLDRKSTNPGRQRFEKMVGDRYLGEIARNMITYLIDCRVLFNGYSSEILNHMNSFATGYIHVIVADPTPELKECQAIFEETLNISPTTIVDRRIIREVCHLIGKRAARLAGVALSALLTESQYRGTDTTIALTGSVFTTYPQFSDIMKETMAKVLGAENAAKVSIEMQNHSLIGGSFVAMMALTQGEP
ncbi:hypothetical protein H4219_001797 [Mycoemilia scoparia]|uniref:Phosphotransferase n=1 Tax=Mycoemilia scoparia TaxID=417184 RepID=A0A9W8A7D3_9FUNG|nr:hypothetical protein H4219_001797 [Mycoemilia scoparia]